MYVYSLKATILLKTTCPISSVKGIRNYISITHGDA